VSSDIISAWKYDHSSERASDLLASCEAKAAEVLKTEDTDEQHGLAKMLRRRCRDVRTILRTNRPTDALAVMFDVGSLARLLHVEVAIPDQFRVLMTPTEAARRLGYSATKSTDDAGRKRVEREIKAGILRANRAGQRSRKWWFDSRQF
jgi:hypothetical protein